MDALCILNENDHPLLRYNSAVLFELGLNRKDIISVGKSALGTKTAAFVLLPLLLSSPRRLNA